MDKLSNTGNVVAAASGPMVDSDQFFLLHFIFGNYFGPALKDMDSRKPALQRIAEGLPPYTLDQLAGSSMKKMEVQRIYQYALRKADRSLLVKLSLLEYFFQGTLTTSDDVPAAARLQFPQFFPPELHPQSKFRSTFTIIDNIAFINDPNPSSYMNQVDVERFKRLTGLQNLALDKNEARFYIYLDGNALYDLPPHQLQPVQLKPTVRQNFDAGNHAGSILQPRDQQVHMMTPPQSLPAPQGNETPLPTGTAPAAPILKRDGATLYFLPSSSSGTTGAPVGACAMTGAATTGLVGPTVGMMDIGESDDKYVFRVSLPGVRRDEREFKCEFDSQGTVFIKGVTVTGEKTVYRHGMEFTMISNNLCPPGQFSIQFQLPGPVDPYSFKGIFGIDGMFEGMVNKATEQQA
ncbi:hypothetical protein Tsubulata_018243 [Turnera subulata]|uniref:SHSP domain-containing protein n=1 Tax=Turnera subulata TaxID=218843 RepID=A0A9Q0FFA7_9ROSI|nr:hypothetical protein Tsubulata_018243 [Turnera subulata]